MGEVFIFGHKNPDTDSVTAAISFARLKNKLGMHARPMILGHINKETEFVLKYFNINVPDYLEDVKLQIKDLNYYKDCFIYDTDSIKKTYDYMCKNNITGVPIVDGNKTLKGILTT